MSAFRDIVAAHHRDSDAVLVAAREPCISLAADETQKVRGRSFRIVHPDDLAKLGLRPSWLAAVLLCKGDDTKRLAAWVREGRRDPQRVIFYLHPDADTQRVLAAWQGAGLPLHATWTVRDWKGLHRHLGAAWNVRIFDDFR